MKKYLEDYSKEDLIKIIGTIHDATGGDYWELGFDDEYDNDNVEYIGRLCKEYCMNNDWNVPNKYLES